MRQALDGLKTRLDTLFATRGRQCFPEPWAARDAYIAVILDRSEESVWRFFREHGYPDLDDTLIREGVWLLEMQRHALLMYTSCGWFFDEISGLETTQCLRYAARAIQLARHFGTEFEEEFLRTLEQAPSNLPQFRNGRGVWEMLVRSWQIDLDRVLAHHAISLLYRPRQTQSRVYCYDLEALEQEVYGRGSNRVGLGRLHVRFRLTWEEAEADFAAIHYGGLDFYTVLREQCKPEQYEGFKKRFHEAFHKGSLADVTALLVREFQGQVRRLDDLFQEEQRRVIGIVLQNRFEDYRLAFERLANQDEDLLNRLALLCYPIPKPLGAAASAYLDWRLREEIAGLETDGSLEHVRQLYQRGQSWGYRPERELLGNTLAEALGRLLQGIEPHTDLECLIARTVQMLDAAALLGITLDLWHPQNQLLDAYARLADLGVLTPSLGEAFATLAEKLNMSRNLLGWRP